MSVGMCFASLKYNENINFLDYKTTREDAK